jgi:hypothetical protein
MHKAVVGDIAGKKHSKIKFVVYSLSIVIAVGILELITRIQYSEAQFLYLPYYGLSENQQNLLIWQHQPGKNKVGTITTPYPFDIYDSKLGWKVKPNADVKHSKLGLWEVGVKTNSFGFRGNNPKERQKLSDVIRIGIMGASQTFGESVHDDEVYVSLLDNKLHQAEVLNFGVRGYGTDQMLLYYESEAKNYNLNFTILAFAFHHMPRNASSFTFYAKPYFITNENSLNLLGSPVPTEFELFDSDTPKLSMYFLNNSMILRLGLKYFRIISLRQVYNEKNAVWNTTKAIITRFSKTVKENNSQFILLNIEHKHENLEPALIKLANELDIDLINLGPTLRNALNAGISVQILNDNHWSAIGHQIVADALYVHLCRKQLILNC